jgi:hypothetical protein
MILSDGGNTHNLLYYKPLQFITHDGTAVAMDNEATFHGLDDIGVQERETSSGIYRLGNASDEPRRRNADARGEWPTRKATSYVDGAVREIADFTELDELRNR